MAMQVVLEIHGHPEYGDPVTLPVGGKLALTHNFEWIDSQCGSTIKQSRTFTVRVREVK